MSGEGLATLRWGTDYLLRTIAKAKGSTAKDPQYLLATQVPPCCCCCCCVLTPCTGLRLALM